MQHVGQQCNWTADCGTVGYLMLSVPVCLLGISLAQRWQLVFVAGSHSMSMAWAAYTLRGTHFLA
jgi:hypothetical protein